MHGPDAALAAAQLLALLTDPVRHRRALTHGREALPGALHAFRFAQGRIPDTLLASLPPHDRGRLAEAAVLFIREVCLWDEATHYQVLGVPPRASPAAIKEHYHALMGLFHPDRQMRSSVPWPASAAPRVNTAYAVLSDEAQRREYDATLAPAPRAVESPRAPSRARVAAKPGRHAKAAALVVAAIAVLAFTWAWFGDPGNDDLAAMHAGRWVRDSLAPALRPKFLATENATAPMGSALAAEAMAPLEPVKPATLARVSALPKLDPAPEPSRASDARPVVAESRPAVAEARPAVTEARPPVLAQGPRPAPAAAAAPAPVPDALAADLELLVAQVVSTYEAGDLDGLVALFDASRIGVFESVSVRHDFEAFFQSTGSRQLQLKSLTWEARGSGARARGEAIVRATYPGSSKGSVERVVPVDMAIAMRDGRPRLVQLTLFPHE